jgi:hypothetical protein
VSWDVIGRVREFRELVEHDKKRKIERNKTTRMLKAFILPPFDTSSTP